jgi:hypothetical protein
VPTIISVLDGPYGANSALSGRSSAEPMGRRRLRRAWLAVSLPTSSGCTSRKCTSGSYSTEFAPGTLTLCACACMHACGSYCVARMCACVCACMRVRVCVCARVHVCVRACDRWVVCSAVHCIARRLHGAVLTFDCWSFFTVDSRVWQRRLAKTIPPCSAPTQHCCCRRTIPPAVKGKSIRCMLCWSHSVRLGR